MDGNDSTSDLAVAGVVSGLDVPPEGDPDSHLLVLHESRESIFCGPLPRPDILEGYERLVPGSAKELIAEAVGNSRSERKINEETFVALRDDSRMNRLFGFVFGVLILAVGLTFMFMGHPNSGAAIILGTLGAVLAIFITGRKQTDRDDLAQPDDD